MGAGRMLRIIFFFIMGLFFGAATMTITTDYPFKAFVLFLALANYFFLGLEIQKEYGIKKVKIN